MDALHRELFTLLLADDWDHGIETAVDVTLCGRYYERFADHAVLIAEETVTEVTGRRTHDLAALLGDDDLAALLGGRG
jgi:phosphate transport system protein